MNANELTTEDVYKYMQHRADKTNDIEVKLYIALIKSGHADFMFLRDDSVRDRWSYYYRRDSGTLRDYNNAMKNYLLKSSAYDKLTDVERKQLKVRKPRKPRDIWK